MGRGYSHVMELSEEFLAAQSDEYEAWQHVVKEWEKLNPVPSGFSFNAPICNAFVCAIRLWGEELVQLRLLQDEDVVKRARNEAIQNWSVA